MVAAAKESLAAALVAAQADMPAVEPDAVNPHFKSKFVSLDHLIAQTRPVLNKHGLAIKQDPTHIDGAPALATTIYHSASGESATSVMPLILSGSDMQKLGAALTYARRYAWAAALGIAGEEDDDGNAASAPAQATPQNRPEEKTAPAEMAKTEAHVAALVEEKGGDTAVFKQALETARKDAKTFEAWLLFQRDHWEKQPKPFSVPPSAQAAGAAA